MSCVAWFYLYITYTILVHERLIHNSRDVEKGVTCKAGKRYDQLKERVIYLGHATARALACKFTIFIKQDVYHFNAPIPKRTPSKPAILLAIGSPQMLTNED
jgi:hypothetical protein